MLHTAQNYFVLPACVVLMVLSGCAFIIQSALVPNRNVEQWTIADPNAYNVHFAKEPNGVATYSWSQEFSFAAEKAIIPYSRDWINPAVVKGQLNGKPYTVIFDTGNSIGLLIEDSQINRHRMPVLFFNPENKNESHGLAFADSLTVGPLHCERYPCFFLKHHAEHKLLGLVPVHRFEWVIVSLPLMTRLGHIEFNQVQRHLRIEQELPFTPEDPSMWLALPFVIENNKLLFKLQIEDISATFFLDTGADYELELSSELAERLFERRPDLQKSWKRNASGYGPYAGGLKKEKKFTANGLQFANHTLDKVEIRYSVTDADPAPPFDGTIGINLFRDTVMVLDFKQNLMWVKKATDSLFEETGKDDV